MHMWAFVPEKQIPRSPAATSCDKSGLLHRDRLRQVAWLIDIATAADRDVIRQQLQRNNLEDRRKQFRSLRYVDYMVGRFFDLFVALGGDGDNGS